MTDQAAIERDFGQELDQARRKEERLRDNAFLELPELVAGVELRPLTLRDVMVLTDVGSPFFCGGIVEPADLGKFLWYMSLEFRPATNWLGRWKMNRFLRRIRDKNFVLTRQAILTYLEACFMDKPPVRTQNVDSPSYFSFAAHYVDLIGERYGWAQADIIKRPVAVLFQIVRKIQTMNEKQPLLFNKYSDKVKGDYLRRLNSPEQTPDDSHRKS